MFSALDKLVQLGEKENVTKHKLLRLNLRGRKNNFFIVTMTAPMERIQVLDSIEKDIITCLHSAGQVFVELSKEKSSLKQAENHTQMFLKTLSAVENKLTDQINYLTQVSTGQPHEGSGYASQKVLQMAWHRLEHARSRVNELDRIKIKHVQGRTAQRAILPSTGGGQMQNVSSSNIAQGSAT